MDSLNLNVINDDEHPIPNQDLLEKCFALVADKHNISQAEVNVSIVSNQKYSKLTNNFVIKISRQILFLLNLRNLKACLKI